VKVSTVLYSLAAAIFVTAFVIDVEEGRKLEADRWRDADTATKLGSNSDVGSHPNGSMVSD